MTDSIDKLIDKIKESELKAEAKRKMLLDVEQEKWALKKRRDALVEEKRKLNKERFDRLTVLGKKESDLKGLEGKVNILLGIHEEMKEKLKAEKDNLERKQRQVWVERENFCAVVQCFISEWGLFANKENEGDDAPQEEDEEMETEDETPSNQAEELQQLQLEVNDLESQLETLTKKLEEAQQNSLQGERDKEELSKAPTGGKEFIRLQVIVRQCKEETENLEHQCEAARVDLWKQERLEQQMIQEKSASRRSSTLDAWLMITRREDGERWRQDVLAGIEIESSISSIVTGETKPKAEFKTSDVASGLAMVFFSTYYEEAAVAFIIILVTLHNIPRSWYVKAVVQWKRRFPPRVRLLSEEEYYAQGVAETCKGLSELREHCSSPECQSWKLMIRLKDPVRFAKFVQGESHLTDNELIAYDENCHSGELFTDDDSDDET